MGFWKRTGKFPHQEGLPIDDSHIWIKETCHSAQASSQTVLLGTSGGWMEPRKDSNRRGWFSEHLECTLA